MPGRKDTRSMTRSGGWSERISPQDSMLGSFVPRQEGTRVGKKRTIRHPGDVVRGGSRCLNVWVCVSVCAGTDECVLSVSVCVLC